MLGRHATGPSGRYDVEEFSRGPKGDVIVRFGMQTTEDGGVPAPQRRWT